MVYKSICNIKETSTGIKIKLRVDDESFIKNIEYQNFFYLLEEDYYDIYEKKQFKLLTRKVDFLIDKDKIKFVKIYPKYNNTQYKFKYLLMENDIKPYEIDIKSEKHFLIDNQHIKLNQKKLKIVFLDIETDDRKPMMKDFKGNIIANSPITGIAFKDLDGKVEFFYNRAKDTEIGKKYKKNRKDLITEKKFDDIFYDEERKLLIKIINYLKNYDVTLSWNGWRFDMPYIRQRCETHGLIEEYEECMLSNIDYMEMYKKNMWGSLKSYSLQNVGLHEFKNEINKKDSEFKGVEEVTKIDWKVKTGLKKFFDLYLFEDKIFREYNIQDVNIMFLIEKKLKYLEIHFIISEICHCPLRDTLHNSKAFDYAMLNEYKKAKIIAPSSPDKQEKEERKKINLPGGYTYVIKTGLFKNLHCFDYKSFYPTQTITYNISPETFVKEVKPNLKKVFSTEEINYINFCENVSLKFLKKDGSLNVKKYNTAIEKYRVENNFLNLHSMYDLMMKFTDLYENKDLEKYCEENDYVYTPADINYDTRGWKVHSHYLFKREQGIFPKLSLEFLEKRDEVKYELKKYEEYSSSWWQHNLYQMALKTLGNSGYGAFGFKSFRFFKKEIPTAITSACRYTMKKSILFAMKNGFKIANGDTDSSYLYDENNAINVKQMDKKFYDYYDLMIKPYNTFCSIKQKNPINGKVEIKKHFIVFEHEKTFESCIVVAKKRYYYKEIKDDGRIKYGTQGGAYKKSNTEKIAAELQKELCKDVLDFTYDKNIWRDKILNLKDKLFSFDIDMKHIVKTDGLNRNPNDYGKAVIDGSTGKQKLRKKDGAPMFAPVPAHITVAKREIARGVDLNVGDKIDYIIIESSPRNVGISIYEYNNLKKLLNDDNNFKLLYKKITGLECKKTSLYDTNYYWSRIISPLIEILSVVDKKNMYTFYADCWTFTKKQLEKLIKNIEEN